MKRIASEPESLTAKAVVIPRPRAKIARCRAWLACGVVIGTSTLGFASEPAIQQLYSFACPHQEIGNCPAGYGPGVLIQASDGNFYGAAQFTTEGTSNSDGGTLFKITPSGQFTLLFTFSPGKNGDYPNGNHPGSSLVEANDGFLYGITLDGGATNSGVLFRIGKDGQGFAVLHEFCSQSSCADGAAPSSLILGHDGRLYGTTTFGGNANSGTIFRFTPATGLTTLLALNLSAQVGAPRGLVQGVDGNFYGVAEAAVFRFSLSGQFTVLTTFPPRNTFFFTDAISGLVQASNDRLYGALTSYSFDQVQFYEINSSGRGFKEFPQIGTLAVDFQVSTLIQASDGNLWTDCTETSALNGTLVAISPTTGAVVHQFDFGNDGASGTTPEASVVQAADGKLYGTASGGGTAGGGQLASGTVWVLDAGLPAPRATIAEFTQSGGKPGTKVLIRGSHFIGTKEVTFNGASASFTTLNTSFISATVPQAATTGPIAVTNEGGTTVSTGKFVVP